MYVSTVSVCLYLSICRKTRIDRYLQIVSSNVSSSGFLLTSYFFAFDTVMITVTCFYSESINCSISPVYFVLELFYMTKVKVEFSYKKKKIKKAIIAKRNLYNQCSHSFFLFAGFYTPYQ